MTILLTFADNVHFVIVVVGYQNARKMTDHWTMHR